MNLPEKITSLFVERDDAEFCARSAEVQALLEKFVDGLPFSMNEDGDGDWVERSDLAHELFEAKAKESEAR